MKRKGIYLILLLLAACDLPTAPPRFETRLIFPGVHSAITIDSLLPPGITIVEDGTAFQVELPSVELSRTLGELCPPCAVFSGQTVPKPPFQAEISMSMPLPPLVTAVTLSGGAVRLVAGNNLSFDPLRPPGGATGRLDVNISSSDRTLGSAGLSGAAEGLPPGSEAFRDIMLAPGEVRDHISVSTLLDSPAGDPVRMDASDYMTFTVAPVDIRFSEATLTVPQREIAVDTVAIDLSDSGDTPADRLRGLVLVVILENPFGITGRLEMAIPEIDLRRTVEVSEGTHRLEFSRDDIQSLLGRESTLMVGGAIDERRDVRVRPSDRISFTTRLELTLEIGGSNE